MTRQNKICGFCNKQLDQTHGNRRYHPECAYAKKKQRSIHQYAKQNLQLDPYWRNEKILRELYHSFGEMVEIDPSLLGNQQFDFNTYKTKRRVNGYWQMFMHNYGLIVKENKKITLCKQLTT